MWETKPEGYTFKVNSQSINSGIFFIIIVADKLLTHPLELVLPKLASIP